MPVLYVALALAFMVAAGGVAAFVWAASREQFDDLHTPAVHVLHDEE